MGDLGDPGNCYHVFMIANTADSLISASWADLLIMRLSKSSHRSGLLANHRFQQAELFIKTMAKKHVHPNEEFSDSANLITQLIFLRPKPAEIEGFELTLQPLRASKSRQRAVPKEAQLLHI